MIRNFSKYSAFFCLASCLFGCSLFFGRTITEKDLKRNKEIVRYEIGDDLALVVKKLNQDGEAVVMGKYEGNPVYVQIFATTSEIIVRHYDVNDYNFGRFDIYLGD